MPAHTTVFAQKKAGHQSLGRAAAIIRIVTGIAYATSASFKIRAGHNGFTETMNWMINERWIDETFSFYRPFLDAIVLPNAELFSFLVTWGEAAVGVGLILGIFTRFTAAFALFISLNIVMASGVLPGAPQADWAFVIAGLTILITRAGRTWGIDKILLARFGHKPWW